MTPMDRSDEGLGVAPGEDARPQGVAGGRAIPLDRRIHWRCFHCGETFTKAQQRWAHEHFGQDQGELPVCQMRMPGEHHLLTALRNAQDQLASYRADDSDLMRAIYAMQADHATALRREEERGYEKGVRDARAKGVASPAAAPALYAALKQLHLTTVAGSDNELHAALDAAWAALCEADGSVPSEGSQERPPAPREGGLPAEPPLNPPDRFNRGPHG